MRGYSADVFSQGMTFMMIWYIMIMILSLVQAVFLGLAVFNDAKSRGNKDPVMWGLLSGLLGWIPAIIYLCVRDKARNRMMVCPQCGFNHAVGEPQCPHCGVQNIYAAPYYANPLAGQQAHRAKIFLILFIVSFAVIIIGSIICGVSLVGFISNAAQAY